MKGKKWVSAKPFEGKPTEENIKLVEYDLPDELQEGEVLLQAVYLTVDPYMRIFPTPIGEPMIGEQLSEVIKSKNGKYPVGNLVLSNAGWQSHYISKGDGLKSIRFDIGSTPISYTLGTLGMPGATAFIALKKVDPKPNEILVVTAAAGALGNVVGQLAKLQGLTVIGVVGSDDKANWCKNELGFDHVINYKKENYSEALSKIAPDGIDILFDSVGGDYYHTTINKHMKKFGRVLVAGSITTYNDKEGQKFEATNQTIFIKELTVKGFLIFSYDDQWAGAFVEMNKMIQEKKLKVRETVYDGIEKMRDAFINIFTGEGIGKVVIKAKNTCTNYP